MYTSKSTLTQIKISNYYINYAVLCMYRKLSGAMIKISNNEEHEASGRSERAITISGQADAVNVAQTLINLRLVTC